MKSHLALTLALGFGVAAGCASNDEPQSELSREEATRVQVTNNNWLDVNVYAVGGSRRERLGTVTSMTTTVLRLPGHILASTGNLQLVADPIGSQTGYSSQIINVWPGQTLSFAVENQLSLSRVILTPD